jgi:hypothetical protein
MAGTARRLLKNKTCRPYAKWMPDKQKRAERRVQQTREIEASQAALKASIAETQRLVEASEAMLKRHRREQEEDEAGG